MGGNEIRFLENEGNPFALAPLTLFIGDVGGATFLSTLFGLQIILRSLDLLDLGPFNVEGCRRGRPYPQPQQVLALDVHVNCSYVHCGR